MKKQDRPTFRLALNLAIQWEESVLDSLKGCNSPLDKIQIERAKVNILKFQALLKNI